MRMQTEDPFRRCLQEITYPVSERALQKWMENRLELIESSEERRHYIFHFEGSTCTNGGIHFHGRIHAVCSVKKHKVILERGWIDFDPEQIPKAKEMCAYKSSGEPFLEKLKEDTKFSGNPLEKIIRGRMPENAAGCFCSEAMINHKWKWTAATIHYSILQGYLKPE